MVSDFELYAALKNGNQYNNIIYNGPLKQNLLEEFAINGGIVNIDNTIIATDVGGVSEMVEEERNGYLLPKDFDVANLRHLFIKMLQTDNEDYQAIKHERRLLVD